MAQFGQKNWFHKIGEEGISSFVKRIIQGIFLGHHDRMAIFYMTKSGIAWESTKWEDLFDNPWHVEITETRLTKKIIADEEGGRLLLPRMLLQRLSAEDSTFCLQILKLQDTLEVVLDARCSLRREKQQSHVISACCHATQPIFQVIRER